MMKIEHKFTSLKSLKVSDKGPGEVSGYRSIFFVIDEGADLIIKGAFDDSQAEFLTSGFTAESHDWTFVNSVGFPVEAHSDDTGWFVRSQFHTTQAAQDCRTIAKERLAAGKQVGFSFGYQVEDYEVISSKDYDAQLPQYIRPDALAENMAKARQFSQIRILKKVRAIEDSLVTSPMNRLARATGVKSTRQQEQNTYKLRSQSLVVLAGAALAGTESLFAAQPKRVLSSKQLLAESRELLRRRYR
jgi:HK97 family phage prohead protease